MNYTILCMEKNTSYNLDFSWNYYIIKAHPIPSKILGNEKNTN